MGSVGGLEAKTMQAYEGELHQITSKMLVNTSHYRKQLKSSSLVMFFNTLLDKDVSLHLT